MRDYKQLTGLSASNAARSYVSPNFPERNNTMEMYALCGLAATAASVFCVGYFALLQLWLGEVGNE